MGFVEHLKQERQEYIELLARLESGEHVGRRPTFGGPHSWEDQTQNEKEKSKKIIAQLDGVIAQHEGS